MFYQRLPKLAGGIEGGEVENTVKALNGKRKQRDDGIDSNLLQKRHRFLVKDRELWCEIIQCRWHHFTFEFLVSLTVMWFNSHHLLNKLSLAVTVVQVCKFGPHPEE